MGHVPMAVDDQGDDELDLDLDQQADDQPTDQQVQDADDDAADDDQPTDQPVDQQAAQVQDQQVVEQVRQPSRRDQRIQTLLDENRRKDQDLADVRRRLDDLTSRVTQPAQRQETPQERAARFALMTPQEQMQETLREAQQSFQSQMQTMQMQGAENADRTAFHAKCAVDPLYAKWAPKVEGKLAELRTKGENVNREVLLKFLIGEAALERRASPDGKKEVRQAQRRVQASRVRPTNSGSDTQAQRRQNSSVERRLENVQI